MVKEKEISYKRLREENEFAQKIEEEKALKQLRRTMVPHARPLPKFDRPFRPQRSTKNVTKPRSPQFHVDQRGASLHPMINLSSSPAVLPVTHPLFLFLFPDAKIIPYPAVHRQIIVVLSDDM